MIQTRTLASLVVAIIICILIQLSIIQYRGTGNRKLSAIFVAHKTTEVDRRVGFKGYFWERQFWKTDSAYAKYWEEVAERKLVRESSERFKVPTAVFHIRCGDVPFTGHPAYRMPSIEFVQFVRQQLIQNGIKLCIVTSCWTWPNWEQISYKNNIRRKKECPKYTAALTQALKADQHYETITRLCLTNNATQHIFHMADVLINHGSTFSFIPGLAKEKRFISDYPGEISDVADKTSLKNAVHWTMFDGPMIDATMFSDNSFDYCAYLSRGQESQDAHKQER